MNYPTLHALARLLAPWRAIRRLEVKNKRLRRSNDRLVDMVFLACSRNVASDRRLRNCPTHGQQPHNVWGCPDCVDQLRQEAREAKQEAEQLWAELAKTREAVRRLIVQGYDSEVRYGVITWATRDGMASPLPPLPERLARREHREGERHG